MQEEESSSQSSVTTSYEKQRRLLSLVVFAGVLLLASVTLVMNKCGRRKVVDGGTSIPTEHSQTTVPTTIPNPTQGHFLGNGLPSTKVGVENVVSTLRSMQENKSSDSTTEILEMTSGRIHVLK